MATEWYSLTVAGVMMVMVVSAVDRTRDATQRSALKEEARMSRSPVPALPAGAAAPSTGQAMPDGSQQGTDGTPPSVRAQLLATEHWSLLATRSTAQSELLSRITAFLMLVSASIVGLALIGQATRFGGRFITFALVLLGMVVMIGTLTQIRVVNSSNEDLAQVIGMNRLRAAYLELDPDIERYLVTSTHDDNRGIWQTYSPLMDPSPTQPLASSAAFILLVNSCLSSVFAALVAVALDAPGPLVGAVATACGLAFLGISLTLVVRQYQRMQRRYVALFPTPDNSRGTRPLGEIAARLMPGA
jgi:hypothetical protein